jgi:Spy/CpxP family protein refolding chaperone
MKKLLVLTVLLAFTFILVAKDMDMMQSGQMCSQCGMMMNNDDDDMMMGKMGPDMMGDKAGMMEMMEALKLTDKQKDQMMMLHMNYKKMSNTKMAEIKNFMMDKMMAMKNEEYANAKKINTNITNDQLALMNAKVDMHMEMMKVLTPEQKQMMKDMMMNMKPMMQKKMMMKKEMIYKDTDKDMDKNMK